MSHSLNNLEDRLALMREHKVNLTKLIPWSNEIGFKVTEIEEGRVFACQPWDERLIGDPDEGIIHGGVITTFLDSLSGICAAASLPEFRWVATLDLRIDYMRPAEPQCDILGEAHCYHITRSVAFIHGWAYHGTKDHMIAASAGAFAINMPREKKTITGEAH